MSTTRLTKPILAVVVLLSVVVVASTTGAAHARPTPVCPVCGDPFEDALRERGVQVDIVESTVTVDVAENGNATWRIRNVVTNGSTVSGIENNRQELRTLVQTRLREEWFEGLAARTTRIEVRRAPDDPRAFVILLHVDEFATRRPGDVLLIDAFYEKPRASFYPVLDGAQRFVLELPDGYRFTNGVAEQGNGTLVVPGRDGVPDELLVATPGQGLGSEAKTRLAIVLHFRTVVVNQLLPHVAALTLVFALGLLEVSRHVGKRPTSDRHPATLGAAVAVGLGVLALLGIVLSVDGLPRIPVGLADYAVAAVLVLICGLVRFRWRPRREDGGGRLTNAQFAAVAVGLGVASAVVVQLHEGAFRGVYLELAGYGVGTVLCSVGLVQYAGRQYHFRRTPGRASVALVLAGCTVVGLAGVATGAPLRVLLASAGVTGAVGFAPVFGIQKPIRGAASLVLPVVAFSVAPLAGYPVLRWYRDVGGVYPILLFVGVGVATAGLCGVVAAGALEREYSPESATPGRR